MKISKHSTEIYEVVPSHQLGRITPLHETNFVRKWATLELI